MGNEINIQQKIQEFKKAYPKYKSYSDTQIISVMQEMGVIKLTTEQQKSLFNSKEVRTGGDSVSFGNTKPVSNIKTLKLKSGEVGVKSSDGKIYNFNKTLEKKINAVESKLKKAEDSNGLIGSAWSWAKNSIGFGASSDKVRTQITKERQLLAQFNSDTNNRPNIFKELTGADYTPDNLEKFLKAQIKLKSEALLDNYKEGQEMVVDITSDVVSGVVAYGTAAACIAGGIAAAPFTAGASLGAVAVGIGIATGAGSVTKVAIKGAESLTGGKKYSLKDAGKDATIGAVSGALAPITIGAGGAVANSVGKVAPKWIATSARFAVEGGTFGGVDGATRSALEGESVGDIALSGLKGAVGGAIAGNILGHSGKAIGKVGQYTYEKFTPVYEGNGFTYRIAPFGKKYKFKLKEDDKYKIDFILQSAKTPNPNPTNLTNELKRVFYQGNQVKSLLQNNPNLSRIVGSLPQKWGKKLASKEGIEQVDKIFYEISSSYHSKKLTNVQLAECQKKLTEILGTNVSIETLGAGNIGLAFKITVDNQKFVLKCFKPIERREWQSIHGNYSELCGALYADKHAPNKFAKFYMGRFGENEDGYILTKFLEGDVPTDESTHAFRFYKKTYAVESHDIKSDNIKGTRFIDYGAVEPNPIIDSFTAKEKQLLNELSIILDKNDKEELKIFMEKYAKTNEFINVKQYIQKIVNDYSAKPKYGINAGYEIEYFIERKDILNAIGVNEIPDIRVFSKTLYPEKPYFVDSDLKDYYGLSFEEWKSLGL